MSEITPNTPNPVREDAYVEELAEKLGIEPQYIPKSPVWRNEEEIKAIAEMFANMEGGGSSGGGVLVVHMDDNEALDKTWSEINTAAHTGPVILYDAPAVYYLVAIGGREGEYWAAFFGSFGISLLKVVTDSESGYPIIT